MIRTKRLDLLLMKTVILDFGFAVLLYWGWDTGTMSDIMSKDTTFISWSIIALFVVGLAWCHYLIIRVSIKINDDYDFPTNADRHDTEANKAIAPLSRISSTLLSMGIIGTIYGIIIALSNANMANLTNLSTVGSELSVMVNGLMVMFVTTITGLVTSTVLSIYIVLLENGYRELYLK